MIPVLANQSLLSGGKFSEAGYISVYDGEEVNIYNGYTTKITVSEKAVLTGWQCPRTRLCRIPLKLQVTNPNLHTDPPTSSPDEAIHNVYELLSIERTICYLHAEAGFPTKSTWIKIIRNSNYLTWPLITVTNVHNHFP